MQMSKGMKALIAILLVEVILGGAFMGWVYFGVNLVDSDKTAKTTQEQAQRQTADQSEAELKAIEDDLNIDTENDKDLSDLDTLKSELSNINLSGI